MLTSDFDFDLPDQLIAQQPVRRGTSRLLVLPRQRSARHLTVGDLPKILHRGDVVVVNDTRVIPARLFARRPETEGKVELLLVERLAEQTWSCLAKPGRKARPGAVLELADGLKAEVIELEDDGKRRVRFSGPLRPRLQEIGTVPLPPYVKRTAGAADRIDYQTIFATTPGAIAAPTAGLHFTPELVETLRSGGVEIVTLTLHVGIGTFKPVTASLAHEHRMDSERFELPPATADAVNRARDGGGRVVAVGTTVVRTLESAARSGGSLLRPAAGRTDLFIRPGFDFRIVDLMLTNFHLPRSTLLMLACAFAGRERVLTAYREAVERGYRFYSYGDATLLERAGGPQDA